MLRRFVFQLDWRASAGSNTAACGMPCSGRPAPTLEPCHAESSSFNSYPHRSPVCCDSVPRRLSGRHLPGRHDAWRSASPDRTRPGRHIGSWTKVRNSGARHAPVLQGLSGGGLLFSAARYARLLGARSGMPTDMPVKPADWGGCPIEPRLADPLRRREGLTGAWA
jgi:hypothetical protein